MPFENRGLSRKGYLLGSNAEALLFQMQQSSRLGRPQKSYQKMCGQEWFDNTHHQGGSKVNRSSTPVCSHSLFCPFISPKKNAACAATLPWAIMCFSLGGSSCGVVLSLMRGDRSTPVCKQSTRQWRCPNEPSVFRSPACLVAHLIVCCCPAEILQK